MVKRNTAVLDIPEPRVWLREFADSSVNFQVQYFSDVKRYNRLEVRSQILFGIWDALKQAGIHIPFPQRDIHVKQLPYPPPAAQGVTPD